MPHDDRLAASLDRIGRRIAAAAGRAGRSPSEITLVAVSKTFPAELVRAAHHAGQHHFGENRVQEAIAKRVELEALPLTWHLIGHLQSNKARKAVTTFSWIQSVDRLELLSRLDAAAGDAGVRPKILIQVDLAREATKHGADRSAVADLAAAAAAAEHLDLRGLMIVPPYPETPEDSRPWFRQLRDLRDDLIATGTPAANLAELSMGMSHDFEVAIEEGATMVRVGTAIFGQRAYGVD